MITKRTKLLALLAAIFPLWFVVDLILQRTIHSRNPTSDFFQPLEPYSLFVMYFVFPCALFMPLFLFSLVWDFWHSKGAHERSR